MGLSSRARLPLLLMLAVLAGSAAAQRNVLPTMGERGVLPVGQEYMMGRVWLMSYRRQAPDEVAKERIRTEQRQVTGAARALGQMK